MILESAMLCLALNVFHESRGQAIPVQEAVAQVTMTRANYDEKNICNVVLQPKQFSWANRITAAPKQQRMKLLMARLPKSSNKEWQESQFVALRTLQGDVVSKVFGASHFYNIKTDNPAWKRRLLFIARVGPFVFMKTRET